MSRRPLTNLNGCGTGPLSPPPALTRAIAALLIVLPVALAAAGCKHETPAQQAQQISAKENTDVAACEQRIRQVVKDPARADQLVALLSDLQTLVRDGAATAKDDRAKLAALNANYAATRGDYQSLLTGQEAQRAALFTRALTLRQRMAALVTDAEWDELKHDRVKTFDAMLAELKS